MSVNLPKFTQLVQLMNNRKRLGSEVLNEVAAGTARNDQATLRVGYVTIPSKDHLLVQSLQNIICTIYQFATSTVLEASDFQSGS